MAASAPWRSLACTWLASFAEGGGGEAAVISCEQGDKGLVCSRNTTAVDNATEVVEIRLQVGRASLESTEISVPGYRLVIEIPEKAGGFMNSIGSMGMGADTVGTWGIILANLAAMGMLLLFCGLIAAFVGHKNKTKINEMQDMVHQGMEVAGITHATSDEEADSSDEDALYIDAEAADSGISLDKKSLAANAANSWRKAGKGKDSHKGAAAKRNPMFSAFAGVATQMMADPHAQEMLRHAREEAGARMQAKDQSRKVFNPMRDSLGSIGASGDSASNLGEGLLSGGTSEFSQSVEDAAHQLVDSVAKRTDNPMAGAITKAAHKKVDSVDGIGDPANKEKDTK